ncbi:MAG TPA: sigma-54 dependent transcriptional regulator [Thermodesulfovibrionales bacterium]|nr:sigma-54 dependent transcriptional regulator [Thermodesulfovibrionales bacterium]
MSHILIIDDDDSVRDALGAFLKENGFMVSMASNGSEGLEILKQEKIDVFLVDLVMPGMGGLDVLNQVTELNIGTPAIIVTAFGTIQTAVDAMKRGAFDYVSKPFVLDELLITIDRALNVSRLQKENILLKKQLKRKYNFEGLIGDAPHMQKVYEMIEKVADTDSTVLITGRSGTGKELIAKTIHFNSSRSSRPFVPLNCAAIPRELLESELFGHEKGAFTGAVMTRAGRFELANEGSLFLDEIGELDPSLQVKLLRVLQEREFERVGGVKTIKVDVRIIAATNRDLEKATKDGKFREDLYYRLNVIPIHIPSLKDRIEDIPLLVDHFIHKFSKKRKRDPMKIPPEVMDCFTRYKWPGNVRELENLIERLTILVTESTVRLSDLPEKFQEAIGDVRVRETQIPATPDNVVRDLDIPETGINLNSLIDNMEKKLLVSALEKTHGVKNKAAELLGLNRTTLIEKLKKKNIEYQK